MLKHLLTSSADGRGQDEKTQLLSSQTCFSDPLSPFLRAEGGPTAPRAPRTRQEPPRWPPLAQIENDTLELSVLLLRAPTPDRWRVTVPPLPTTATRACPEQKPLNNERVFEHDFKVTVALINSIRFNKCLSCNYCVPGIFLGMSRIGAEQTDTFLHRNETQGI